MKRLEFSNDRSLLLEALIPQQTSSYTPISNKELFDIFDEELDRHSLKITKEYYKGNGNKFIGQFDINDTSEDIGMRIMFGNSYDKTMSFGFGLGARVLVCENGVVSGEVSLKRKHTGNASEEAIQKIRLGLSQIEENFNNIKEAREKLNNHCIDKRITSDLVGRFFMEEGILNTLQMNIIKKEVNESTMFNTVDNPNYSLWDLYNHITYSLKESHPNSFMRDHIRLHEVMTNLV